MVVGDGGSVRSRRRRRRRRRRTDGGGVSSDESSSSSSSSACTDSDDDESGGGGNDALSHSIAVIDGFVALSTAHTASADVGLPDGRAREAFAARRPTIRLPNTMDDEVKQRLLLLHHHGGGQRTFVPLEIDSEETPHVDKTSDSSEILPAIAGVPMATIIAPPSERRYRAMSETASHDREERRRGWIRRHHSRDVILGSSDATVVVGEREEDEEQQYRPIVPAADDDVSMQIDAVHKRAKHRWKQAFARTEAEMALGSAKIKWWMIYHRPRYEDSYDKHNLWFIPIITFVQALCFVVYACKAGFATWNSPTAGDEDLWYRLIGPANVGEGETPCEDLRGETWRFFSYQFVHAGIGHILFNVFLQLFLGVPLELVHGPKRLALAYQLGVFGGSLTCSFLNIDRIVVGASGGVYSLFGIHFANLMLNWDDMAMRWWRLSFLIFFAGIEVANFWISHGGSDGSTSLGAHYGGAWTGFFAGMVILKNLHHERYEDFLEFFFASLGFIYIIFGIIWLAMNFPPEPAPFLWYDAVDEYQCCWKLLKWGVPVGNTTLSDYGCVDLVQVWYLRQPIEDDGKGWL